MRASKTAISLAVAAAIGTSSHSLFEDFEITDPALRDCVKKAIAANVVTAASQLASLTCTNAGITSLAGLATFTEIEELRLSGNTIGDISELSSLTVLQQLYLDHNQVIEAVPLYQLPALEFVDLSNNPELLCPASGTLLRLRSAILPAHCRRMSGSAG